MLMSVVGVGSAASAQASGPSIHVTHSVAVAFRVTHADSSVFFDFASSGSGLYTAAYFPDFHMGWARVHDPRAAVAENLYLPFGGVPQELTLRPGHTYTVDFVVDKPTTIAFPEPRQWYRVLWVHQRNYRVVLHSTTATVVGGTAVAASVANPLAGSTVSVVALVVQHAASASPNRVYDSQACTASTPVAHCTSSTGLFWSNPPDIDATGTVYASPNSDSFADGSEVLVSGPPLKAAMMCAFGLYLQ